MSVKIEELINIHKGKICHLFGHGQSLNNYIDNIKTVDRNNDIIFSVNDVDIITGINPDYWLFSNPGYKVEDMKNRFGDNTTVIFSDSYDPSDSDDLNNNESTVKYYRYDSVHFKCVPNIWHCKGCRLGCQRGWVNCCDRIIKDRLTIQELLQKHSDYNTHYSTGDSCIIHALAFSVLMGFDEINIYGVDLDYTKGYYNGHFTNSNGSANHGDSFDYWMDRIKSDFYIINESSKKIDVKINFFGGSESISDIINNNKIPEKIYDGDCKNYE